MPGRQQASQLLKKKGQALQINDLIDFLQHITRAQKS